MAAEGKNKVATSLLDLQPTAVLELFKFFPDQINQPNSYLGFHGGSIFDKSIVWQGTQYLPLAFESEGFDILGDGKLSRPIVRVANNNNIITNLLQNHSDFINASVIRKRVSVKFLDDANFDGGNPFGLADPTAELTEEKWIMGRKTQESKLFVEFELNSPLDLESFSVNARSVVAKFCYWQYRGEGCRYAGVPIERDDASPFLDPDGNEVAPVWPSSYSNLSAPVDFFSDPTAEWNEKYGYLKGDIVVVSSPSIRVPSRYGPQGAGGAPLKTAYVCVTGEPDNRTVGKRPEGNPTYWQKDGCSKKFGACQKRFNAFDQVAFREGQIVSTGFSGIRITGMDSYGKDDWWCPSNTGLFHSNEVTGYLTGEFTLVGWASTNATTSAYGAGIFSSCQRSDSVWPTCRYINIGAATDNLPDTETVPGATFESGPNIAGNFIFAYHMGYEMSPTSYDKEDNTYRLKELNYMHREDVGPDQTAKPHDWHLYVTRHSFLAEEQTQEDDTLIEFFVNGDELPALDFGMRSDFLGDAFPFANISEGMGNFASLAERQSSAFNRDDGTPKVVNNGLPECFMLGAAEHYYGAKGYVGYDDGAGGTAYNPPFTSSINGALGPWALWNRPLNNEELNYLYKAVVVPLDEFSPLEFVPRPYEECTGRMSTLTGGTGDGLPWPQEPILYGQNSLIAWWDGSTGIPSSSDHWSPGTVNGMIDIPTGGFHLTGSGQFTGFQQTYEIQPVVILDNPTSPFPRYGGYPGTDGFSYGRDAAL